MSVFLLRSLIYWFCDQPFTSVGSTANQDDFHAFIERMRLDGRFGKAFSSLLWVLSHTPLQITLTVSERTFVLLSSAGLDQMRNPITGKDWNEFWAARKAARIAAASESSSSRAGKGAEKLDTGKGKGVLRKFWGS